MSEPAKKRPEIVSISCALLILDETIYPRNNVESEHVNRIADAIKAGKRLPPVVADRKTKVLTDGFHRHRAAIRVGGPDALIEVEFRDYASRREMVIDAMEMNAIHGKRLDSCDRARCGQLAQEHGISMTIVARIFNLPTNRFKEALKERTALSKEGGYVIPLKRPNMHLAGRQLTKDQEEANKKDMGIGIVQTVNQLLLKLRVPGMVDTKDARIVEKLRELYAELRTFLRKVKA